MHSHINSLHLVCRGLDPLLRRLLGALIFGLHFIGTQYVILIVCLKPT
jgi:hypothetical protein